MQEVKRQAKRTTVAIVGGAVLVMGIIAIPYPGPGWAIVFAGLAILATEFSWARQLLSKAKGEYDKWQQWVKRQPLYLRLLILAFTALVVIVTLWLFNVYGMFDQLLHLHMPALHSPLGLFK
jgi:uncharacterized protein (TIGR02611 family)